MNCNGVSDTFDPFLDISLEIEVINLKFLFLCKRIQGAITKLLFFLSLQNAPTLNEALEQFVRPEILGGENAYKCDR